MCQSIFKFLHSAAAAMLLISCGGTTRHEAQPAEEGWLQLFNGRDLDGWTPKFAGQELGVNYLDTFAVEEGVIRARYDAYDKFAGEFGHLFYRQPFSKYRLRIEYRFTGEPTPGQPSWAFRNSGVMLHAQAPETMRRDQAFPVSLEAQFLGGDGAKPRPTLNLCTPGTHVVMNGQLHKDHCTDSRSDTFHGDQWVTAEIEVNGGGVIRHLINGVPVIEYEQPQYDGADADAKKLMTGSDTIIREGYIALQAESHPVEFRRVELLPLD